MIKYVVLILFISLAARADEESVFAEIARLRQYASGADECDLKVQPVLNKGQRKKKKQIKQEPIEGF